MRHSAFTRALRIFIALCGAALVIIPVSSAAGVSATLTAPLGGVGPDAPEQPSKKGDPAEPETDSRALSKHKVEAAVANGLSLYRPGQVGIVTIWDGNKYAQCRQGPKDWVTCEAAGVALQPSLVHVVTADRAMRLFNLGWTTDPHFGNYLRMFPQTTASKTVARHLLSALSEGYDADLTALEVRTTWLADKPCLPRNGPRQPLAGSIDDSPAMAATSLHGCAYAPAVLAMTRMTSVGELIGLYGQRVRGEMERLIVNSGTEGLHLVLSAKSGYVQCAPDNAPPAINCEAASADSMPSLQKVLTPERVAELHKLGFADPGRAPNYARTTLLAQADAGSLTQDLLTILFDVYGYRGDPVLVFSTERGHWN